MSPAQGNVPSFGSRLRCERLGWHWLGSRRMWLRISPQGPYSFRIEVASMGDVPAEQSVNDEYLVWWKAPEEAVDAMLEACAPLRGLAASTGYRCFVVDEAGREVSS